MSTTLVLVMAGLLLVLILLVSLYIWNTRSRGTASVPVQCGESFEMLYERIANAHTSAEELRYACEAILECHRAITQETLHRYVQMIEVLCVHPHTDSKLIVRCEKLLREANPEYAKQIGQALSKGLATRG